MTVGPGIIHPRYPLATAKRMKWIPPDAPSTSSGQSSSSSSGHPYKRSQTAASTSSGQGKYKNYVTVKTPLPPVLVPARRPHAVVQGAQNPGALSPPNPRAEKRRFIQQHLVLILHAFQCRRKQLHEFCQLPHCATFREVLGHMNTCQQDVACPYPHCTSSKQIYRHWKSCHKADCSICVPIRLADRLERNHYWLCKVYLSWILISHTSQLIVLQNVIFMSWLLKSSPLCWAPDVLCSVELPFSMSLHTQAWGLASLLTSWWTASHDKTTSWSYHLKLVFKWIYCLKLDRSHPNVSPYNCKEPLGDHLGFVKKWLIPWHLLVWNEHTNFKWTFSSTFQYPVFILFVWKHHH